MEESDRDGLVVVAGTVQQERHFEGMQNERGSVALPALTRVDIRRIYCRPRCD